MSAQNKVNSTVLDQAAEWTTIVDSGEMSEEQRLDFNTWVDEPQNARELGAMRTLVSLIQELPEKKAATLRRMPLAAHALSRAGAAVGSTPGGSPGSPPRPGDSQSSARGSTSGAVREILHSVIQHRDG